MNFNGLEQWYMTVEEVAKGYGVAKSTIMTHLSDHSDEIREGVERGGVGITDSIGRHQIGVVIYREGVIKLGFFIRKSERAAMFRQWATDLIMEVMDQKNITLNDVFTRLDKIENVCQGLDGVCRGLRDEVDELRDTLAVLMSDNDAKIIRGLIAEVKATTGMDGRAIVGGVRAALNVGSVYDAPHPRQVINALRNMIGKGIKLVEEDK